MDIREFHKNVKALSKPHPFLRFWNIFCKKQQASLILFCLCQHHSALQAYALKPKISSELIRLYESNPSFHAEDLKDPSKIPALQKLERKVSPEKKLFPYWIYVDQEPFGLFFLPEDSSTMQSPSALCRVEMPKSLFEKTKSPRGVFKTLYVEISRSRRLGLPVSLILIQCLSKEAFFF